MQKTDVQRLDLATSTPIPIPQSQVWQVGERSNAAVLGRYPAAFEKWANDLLMEEIVPLGEVLALVLHGSCTDALRNGTQYLLHHCKVLQILVCLK